MLPDRVSNPGPLTYESGALPTALRGPAIFYCTFSINLAISDMVSQYLALLWRVDHSRERITTS